jgi:hypothetical protein
MEYNILNKVIFITLFTFFFFINSHANECMAGRVKYFEFGESKTYRSNFCTNLKRNTFISKSCLNGGCDALEVNYQVPESNLYSEVGKPGFKLCRILGGQPKILKFEVDGAWFKLDRCFFKSDRSFVDTGSLMNHYLK